MTCAVHFVPDEFTSAPFMTAKPPFTISGAHNVILETIKRGEDDDFKSGANPTVVLRLYEAFGGHARVKLSISEDFHVSKASITNLLEDELDVLRVATDNDDLQSVKLDFHGFEVKTVKLTLGSKPQ